MAARADFLVIGAGMAGASAGYELAAAGRVIVLEQEDRPGVHATGRSAALFSETYGNATVRALSRASRPFLAAPPGGFCESALLGPRGALFIAAEADRPLLEAEAAEGGDAFESLSGDEVRALVPILKPEASAAGLLEPGAMDIDVDALHQGYLRGLRQRGGEVIAEAGVADLRRERGVWTAETGRGGDGDDRPIRDQGGGFVWGKDAGKGYGLISSLEV